MRGWIKGTLLIVLVFGLCWGGAIWYWQATNRMPANGELALYLVVLPLALLLAFVIGRKLMTTAAAAPAAAVASDTAPAAPPPPPPVPPLALLASGVRSAHGATPDELASAFADNKARADLDADLVDDSGFPLMTARSDDAEDDEVQEQIKAWLLANDMPALRFSDEQLRALTLAGAVATDLAGAAAELLASAAPPAASAELASAPPMLQLLPILPGDWELAHRRAAGLWLRHTLVDAGWPDKSINLAAELPTDARAAGPGAALSRLAHHSMTSDAPLLAMLLACGSHIGEDSVQALAAEGKLFTTNAPHGLIPGEGAAGLLVADLAQARKLEGAAFALLHPAAEGRRDASADASRRSDPKLLATLAGKALAHAPEPDKVAMILSDTGHRSSRVQELMGVATATLPQLDPAADVVCVGNASGSCGAVPFMTALALARYQALERSAPVLCLSNEDPYLRSATLVAPAESLS